jgi:hypothetical protein
VRVKLQWKFDPLSLRKHQAYKMSTNKYFTTKEYLERIKSKSQAHRQKETILRIFNHIKDPQRRISNQDFENYLFYLNTIITITNSPSVARNAQKVAKLLRKYIKYCFKNSSSKHRNKYSHIEIGPGSGIPGLLTGGSGIRVVILIIRVIVGGSTHDSTHRLAYPGESG